jgi:hypothetical protein
MPRERRRSAADTGQEPAAVDEEVARGRILGRVAVYVYPAIGLHLDHELAAGLERDEAVSGRIDRIEDDLYSFLEEHGENLKAAILADVQLQYGSVEAWTKWGKGSIVIEVVLVLMAAATLYKDIVKDLPIYREHLASIVRHFFQDFDPTLPGDVVRVQVSSAAGPAALSQLETESDSSGRSRYALYGFLLIVTMFAFAAYLFYLFVGP